MNNVRKELLKKAGVYFVTSTELSLGPTSEILRLYLNAGGRMFQLREKMMSRDELLQLSKYSRKIADEYGALFIVNDDVALAKMSNADGVHLGQDDMSVNEARQMLGDDLIIGVSTHNVEEVLLAQEQGADYINLGPIYPTKTKEHITPLGIAGLEKILPYVKIPFTFMGGLKENNIAPLLKYKPCALAMVTEISKAIDVENKVKSLISVCINSY
ncbi:MAG: thiamine phosphate synthase [bacterium]